MILNKATDSWINTVATFKWIFIILIILALILIVFIYLKKKSHSPVQTKPKTAEPVKKVSAHDEQSEQRLRLLGKHIRNTAGSFNGLYEGIYQLAHGSDNAGNDALVELKLRVENMKENEEFQKAFSDLFDSAPDDFGKQAEKLLRCMEYAGIKRSEETECSYELNVSKKYICLSGNDLEPGSVCNVLKPYWYIDDKVIEQGCIIRKEQ